jgi:hypothetical protein
MWKVHMCSLRCCGRGWCKWRTHGYNPNSSVVFNGRRLFSFNESGGPAAGTRHLAKYQVGVDIRMLLLDVNSVLVGATPFGATINVRTWNARTWSASLSNDG